MQRLTISKTFRFEASHILPNHPGKCSQLHGHSWVLTVGVSGLVNPDTGFVVDYGDLSKLVNERIVYHLDHHHLGQGNVIRFTPLGEEQVFSSPFGPDFYPSSENLVLTIADCLAPLMQTIPGYRVEQGPGESLHLAYVALEETCTSRAEWRSK